MGQKRIIGWDEDGYPTEESLQRLREAVKVKDYEQAIVAFYAALKENYYPDYCGPERIEVRGEVINVWGYHTGGWSGNEDIIAVLQESWLWGWLLERYDRGGHYYFRPMERVLKVTLRNAGRSRRKSTSLDTGETARNLIFLKRGDGYGT